jgi:hypothetical protein
MLVDAPYGRILRTFNAIYFTLSGNEWDIGFPGFHPLNKYFCKTVGEIKMEDLILFFLFRRARRARIYVERCREYTLEIYKQFAKSIVNLLNGGHGKCKKLNDFLFLCSC